MARRTLNDRTIKALKAAPMGQRCDLWDTVVPGFGVRSTDKGNHTYVLLSRFPGSRNPTRRTISDVGASSLADAREKARHWLALIAKGIDPAIEVERQQLAEQRRSADTFAAVAERFFASRNLKTQRRGPVVERVVRRELLPSLGARPVTDVSHRDIREIVQRVAERAPTYAHNVFDAANAVLNFAAAQDLIEANPCRLLKRNAILQAKKHRERVLGNTELQAFWRASGRLDYPFGPFFRLLLLTGCRLNELGGACWGEIDLKAKTWTIPAAEFKSNSAHIVPLTDHAMAVLETLPRFNSGDYLFSATFGKTSVTGFSTAKERLDQHMLAALREMAGHDPRAVELVPFVSHDVRRTVRSRLSALKVQDHIAEAVIGHARKGIARVYDMHKFDDEKREALTKWAMLLHSIIEPPPPNVVPIRA